MQRLRLFLGMLTGTMKPETSAIITSTLLAGLLAAPSPAPAAGAEQSYVLQTRIVERSPSIEEVDGSLLLRITPAASFRAATGRNTVSASSRSAEA
jgi:hypothetical protein